jgi:hypothetical protein
MKPKSRHWFEIYVQGHGACAKKFYEAVFSSGPKLDPLADARCPALGHVPTLSTWKRTAGRGRRGRWVKMDGRAIRRRWHAGSIFIATNCAVGSQTRRGEWLQSTIYKDKVLDPASNGQIRALVTDQKPKAP